MHLAVLVAVENSLFKAVGDIFHPLFVAIAAVLAWIYGLDHTYAVAIIVLTVLIMALMTPLTIKSTRSMLAMQALQPEMQKLRAKYKGPENRQQLNEEMMKLYREHGVSPTGGCLPMFLQMPAFIVLYDTIRGLANTVKKGAVMGTGKRVCHAAICATPRYIPHDSAMYKHLLETPGVMHSIGLNLAAKPLTHRGIWYDYIPYFALLLVAVGLQYFQMAQMTRRNKKNNTAPQVPQQMQTMQRVMPLIFAYIYFLVPAGVVIYMVVSSAIRVLTQDLIFRYGLVQSPGGREIGAGRSGGRPAGAKPEAIPAQSTVAPGKAGGGTVAGRDGTQQGPAAGVGGAAAPGQSAAPGGQPAASARGRRPARSDRPTGGVGANGRNRSRMNGEGTTVGSTEMAPKPHPRSKSKRARKAR